MIIYGIMKKEARKEKKKFNLFGKIRNLWEKHPVWFVIAAFLIIIFFVSFWAKIILYLNFLLGNDTLIQLSSDKQELFLLRNQADTIKFNADIKTNPFCEAVCSYEFEDISRNLSIDKNNFSLANSIPFSRQYSINEQSLGTGLEIYRFGIECKSIKTILCSTSEETSKRVMLVTVNYNLSAGDQEYINSLKAQIENISYNLDMLGKNAAFFNSTLAKLNEKIVLNISENDTKNLEFEILGSRNRFNGLYDLWKNQSYQNLQNEIDNFNANLGNNLAVYSQLNETILVSISDYNALIDILNETSVELANLSGIQLNETNANKLNSLITEFNNSLSLFNNRTVIPEKKSLVYNISNKVYEFSNINNSGNVSNITILSIPDVNIITKFDTYRNFTSNSTNIIHIEEPLPRCCVQNKCSACCVSNECKNSPENYPIVFLHGHAFNKDLPVEFNLDGFNKIQDNLEGDAYLNAGAISLYSGDLTGSWSMIPTPLTLKASYYYDLLKEKDGYVTVQVKSENIDTYAVRLNDLINNIQKKTGRPKVTIIAHSMGGLVARRYAQIFGPDKIDKIILIGTPNKGIEGSIESYCPIIGEKLECEDMRSDSLFMNKLNRDLPNVPTYMIIGTGCNMNGEDGDGIVLKRNAILEGADNIFINGTCSGVDFLHVDMLDPGKYPQVYKEIEKAMNLTLTISTTINV